MVRNPFATSREDDSYGGVQYVPTVAPQQSSRYASPGLTDENGYIDKFGWGPSLRTGTETIPDSRRLQQAPVWDETTNPTHNDVPWQQIDQDKKERYGQSERINPDVWKEDRSYRGYADPSVNVYERFGVNPRATPPLEHRYTSDLAPRGYAYLRPFDQHNRAYPDADIGSARHLNGLHFSMADHRRNYQILGMAPQRMPGAGSRNTYRLDPAPWDSNIQDRTAPYQPPERIITQTEVPGPVSRSYRLGG